jgi:hypothetical protein
VATIPSRLLKTKKKSIHSGPLSQLKPLEEALLRYIFKQRKQGIKISTLSIVVVVLNLSTKFGKKDFIARCSAVKRFVRSVVYKIQELGVEVKHIPGGCTSLCQPVDVGLNQLFKSCIQKMWIKWMIAKGVQEGTTSLPTRHNVAVWVKKAMAQMKEEHWIIKKAWLKAGFEWLDKQKREGVLGVLGGLEGNI